MEKICEVHQKMMKLLTVPISYGLPPNDEELWLARKKLFPNAKSYVLGGCSVGSAESASEELACEECRDAEKRWFHEHPRPYYPLEPERLRLENAIQIRTLSALV
jgi:hypothetical protein